MHGLLRNFKHEKAQALVEMALILPILLLLLVGICEFGRILGAYMLINNLARDGARYGVVGHNEAAIEALVISECSWLDEANLDVQVSPADAYRRKGETLGVQVTYHIEPMTPLLASIVAGPVALNATCNMRIE